MPRRHPGVSFQESLNRLAPDDGLRVDFQRQNQNPRLAAEDHSVLFTNERETRRMTRLAEAHERAVR